MSHDVNDEAAGRQTPGCDGAHCRPELWPDGELRRFELGGNSAVILCMPCFAHENRQRNFWGWEQSDWSQAPVAGEAAEVAAAAVVKHRMTDDPRDPCVYCVQWECPEHPYPYSGDDCGMECSYIPRLPSGPVERVYKGVCKNCARAITEYANRARTDVQAAGRGKILACVECGQRQDVDPSVERVWCAACSRQ